MSNDAAPAAGPPDPDFAPAMTAALSVGAEIINAYVHDQQDALNAHLHALVTTHADEWPWVVIAWADTILCEQGITERGPHIAAIHRAADLPLHHPYDGTDPDIAAAARWALDVLDARIDDNYNKFTTLIRSTPTPALAAVRAGAVALLLAALIINHPGENTHDH